MKLNEQYWAAINAEGEIFQDQVDLGISESEEEIDNRIASERHFDRKGETKYRKIKIRIVEVS